MAGRRGQGHGQRRRAAREVPRGQGHRLRRHALRLHRPAQRPGPGHHPGRSEADRPAGQRARPRQVRSAALHHLQRPDRRRFPKGEKALTEFVDKSLRELEQDGQAQKIYDTWFGPQTKTPLARLYKIGDKS
ncbi:transporter substrate-binding domain-containing protein [Pseudomonas aeruginosa]|uniref:transporter substrate-binding domain-containing protein n=1 Tax=Pseudomonas aeruginosa TaxID=287 RepID=UPI003D04380A